MEVILLLAALFIYVLRWYTIFILSFCFVLAIPTLFTYWIAIIVCCAGFGFFSVPWFVVPVAAFGGYSAILYNRYSYRDGSEYSGARASRWFRRLRIWRVLHWWTNFRPLNEVFQAHHPRCLFAVHPHGFLPIAILLGFALPGCAGSIHGAVDPLIATFWIPFWIPIIRDLFLWSGGIVADKDAMIRALNRCSVVVAPGGLHEGMLHDHHKLAFSFKHMGFLDVATKAAVPVVPVFAQGENRLWFILPIFRALRNQFYQFFSVPFPTIFIPFIFPHDLRLVARHELAYPVSPKVFQKEILDLVNEFECDEDIKGMIIEEK